MRNHAGYLLTQAARWLFIALLCAATANVAAGPREQARRMHDRIAGVPPTQSVLAAMEADIAGGDPQAAAERAMNSKSFYNVTLKQMVTPWTNREQTAFAPLNDYTATVIGAVRDGLDFRRILFDDLLYIGTNPGSGSALPAYSNNDNGHYEELERRGYDLRTALVQRSQSSVTGLPSDATAGVITSRAAAKAFFFAGTNRAMLRFTLVNHLCRDLEQVKDNTRPPDRIRQDVSRSPGGDSRVFHATCLACHAGMDPLAQAFAYYDFVGEEGSPLGSLSYNGPGVADAFTGTRVKKKYLINGNNFVHGYITPDDGWDNYWRGGVNSHLGWSGALPGSGAGAKSLGLELANSNAFAQCQVRKVFRTVCQRPPASGGDINEIQRITGVFRDNDFDLKTVFAETGAYCRGP